MLLIDVDALKKSFCENGVKNCIVQEIIDNAPTIDAEPVRHGRWEESPTGNQNFKYCSECGGAIYMEVYFEYCPHCGAKMEVT